MELICKKFLEEINTTKNVTFFTICIKAKLLTLSRLRYIVPSFILKSLPLFITTIGRFSSLSAKSLLDYSMAPKSTKNRQKWHQKAKKITLSQQKRPFIKKISSSKTVPAHECAAIRRGKQPQQVLGGENHNTSRVQTEKHHFIFVTARLGFVSAW